MAASGCVPNRTTMQDNRAQVGTASIRHAGSNTDPIILTCTIPPFDAEGTEDWMLGMTSVNSNGTGPNAFVRARLYRMEIGSDTPVLLASVNSNVDENTGVNFLGSNVFTHTFNFNINAYWVHVDLDRSSTAQDAILHAVFVGPPAISDVRAKRDIILLGHLESGLGFYRFRYYRWR